MQGKPRSAVRPARGPGDLRLASELIREYAESLAFRLDFQDFTAELEEFPGHYAPPSGEILIARVEGAAAGVVGLRAFDEQTSEMKRLYVRPGFRGHGIGRELAEAIVLVARDRGYRTMLLDTVPSMTDAISLYRSLGFVEVPPYRFNPIPGAVFLRLDLVQPRARNIP